MANRFLPLYLLLLLLGTNTPLWAQVNPWLGCGTYLEQGHSESCGYVSDVNAAREAGWNFPFPPHLEPVRHMIPPEAIPQIENDYAFKLLTECMENKVGVDVKEAGLKSGWVKELEECNEEVFSQEFTMEFVWFGKVMGDHSWDYYEKLLDLGAKIRNDGCIGMLSIRRWEPFGPDFFGWEKSSGHAVSVIGVKVASITDISVTIREPNHPVAPTKLHVSTPDRDSYWGQPNMFVVDTDCKDINEMYDQDEISFEDGIGMVSDRKWLCNYTTASGYYLKCPVSEEETTEEKGLED